MLGQDLPALPMRATVDQALGRVQEYITALENERVPTALLKERVKAIRAWGSSVRARGAGDGAKSEQIRKIQEQLDKARDSELYVRAQRETNKYYPYESEEQHRMALVLNGMAISQQSKDDLFKALHGGGGKRPLLAADLLTDANKRLLSARHIDECAKKLQRYECAVRIAGDTRARPAEPVPSPPRGCVCAASSGKRRC